MKVNFSINQIASLRAQSIDPDLQQGVCTAMVIDWLKRELNGEPQRYSYYRNAYQFASRQRGLEVRNLMRNPSGPIFKSERLQSMVWAPIGYSQFVDELLPVRTGVFIIDLIPFDISGESHCLGLSIAKGKYKLLDPNYAEYQAGNISNGTQALSEFMRHMQEHYYNRGLKRIKITELWQE